MNIGTTLKNIGNTIGKKIESVANERELRLNDPVFKRELMLSRNEFVKHISNAGSDALSAAFHMMLKAPAVTATYALRSIVEDKQTFGNALSRGVDEFNTGANDLGKAVVHTLKSAGRLSLHTLRWVFAK